MSGADAPHDFYNDVRYMFCSTLSAGAVVKLGRFRRQLTLVFDNTGVKDSTTALQHAINAAETSGQVVYLPAGTYTISNPLNVNNVTVEGAGEWYTVLTGSSVEFAGQISPASTNVNVSNLAIFGNVAVRDDRNGSVNGFNGGFSNSTISNVRIQNTKVGAWIVGPATGLTFNSLRIGHPRQLYS